jgi:tetratricopeptide (TPR) repeat protein
MEDVARYLQQGLTKLLSFGVEGVDANPDKSAILAMFEQGVRSYVRSDFQTAIDFFKKALGRAEGNAYLTAYLQKSQQMLEQQIQDVFQEGVNAQQNGEFLTAQKEFSKVLRLSPGHPDAVRQLGALKAQIAQSIETLYSQGKEAFDGNDLDKAIRLWGQILELEPSNERAQKKLEEAKQKRNTLSGIFSKIG